jgi:alkanesulfonate monooxygenase
LIERSRNEGWTVRQLAQWVGGAFGVLEMIGTPQSVADQMEQWQAAGACDGFNVMFPWLPGGLDDLVDRVVPELQQRKLFRRTDEGCTLREHLGLPRSGNRFFS